MKPGDVVLTKSIRSEHGRGILAEYRAAEGRKLKPTDPKPAFVVLVLGITPDLESPFDAEGALRSLGWTPATPAADSWLPCPDEPPEDGWYWVRWASAQDEWPAQVMGGDAWTRRGDRVPWRRFVSHHAGQYWPVPIEAPPDLWTDEAQALWTARDQKGGAS